MAIIDLFDRGWRMNPSAVAYVQDDIEHSFDSVRKRSNQVANALLTAGFKKETKGAIWAKNDVQAWCCTLGLWRANMCWIPLGALNPASENAAQLQAFDCDVLFFQHAFITSIRDIAPELGNIRQFVCIDSDDLGDLPGAVSLQVWIQSEPDTAPEIDVEMDDVVMLSPTGGTTGTPKGVMNTHRSLQTFCAHFMMAINYPAESPPINLAAAPMTHTAGLLSLPCTARGGKVVIVTKPDPTILLAMIPKYHISEFFLPPTVIYRLLEIPELNKKVDFSSLRYLMYGAAPMSVEKLKQAISVFGPVMTGGYGQTEAPAAIAYLRPDEHFEYDDLATDERLGSVGRPNPLIRVEIFDDNNQILPTGQVGEICVKGDLVMKGYYKAPEKTAETIIQGWLHTGDIGYLDGEGYLHITDRKKDMIISGGFNIYPSEIEQVIWSHPAVQDCAVIGVPDSEWGEAVKAVVELNAGQSATEQELLALCKEKLGSVKSPKSIDFITSLPRSPVGKVLKKDLRDHYWQGQSRKI